MKRLNQKPVIDHDPNAKLRPKPMGWIRRLVCIGFGVFLAFAGLYCVALPLENGASGGRLVVAGFFLWFGSAVMIGTGLFPSFTLAREKDRNWRG